MSLSELAQIAIQLGADAALNLDGGGSTTLVVNTPAGATVLNSPIHTKIPMRERPVANHLGFYARPVRSLKEPALAAAQIAIVEVVSIK